MFSSKNNFISLELKLREHYIIGHQENYGANWVSLKDSSSKMEWDWHPLGGLDNTLGVAIAAFEVVENIWWENVPDEGFVN